MGKNNNLMIVITCKIVEQQELSLIGDVNAKWYNYFGRQFDISQS